MNLAANKRVRGLERGKELKSEKKEEESSCVDARNLWLIQSNICI
jgi:hypothetical protein